MKTALVLFFVFLGLTGCGGGDSSDGAGGGEPDPGAPPADIAGNYKGTWNGSGTDANGRFTCSGSFTMSITQSGSSLVIKMSVLNGTGECDEAFEFSGGGTYNATTGEISMSLESTPNTADITGTVVQTDLVITMSGQWSITDSASASVLSSGTWKAEPL